MQGDAREKSYQRALEGRCAQLLFTDPPYCLLQRRRAGGDLRDKKSRKFYHELVGRFPDVRSYRAFTEAWLPKAVAQLQGDAPLILWTNFLGKEPLRTVARACGYGALWGEFLWAKRTQPGDGNEVLLRVYEVALVLGREPQPGSRSTRRRAAGRSRPATTMRERRRGSACIPITSRSACSSRPWRSYSRPGELVSIPSRGAARCPRPPCGWDATPRASSSSLRGPAGCKSGSRARPDLDKQQRRPAWQRAERRVGERELAPEFSVCLGGLPSVAHPRRLRQVDLGAERRIGRTQRQNRVATSSTVKNIKSSANTTLSAMISRGAPLYSRRCMKKISTSRLLVVAMASASGSAMVPRCCLPVITVSSVIPHKTIETIT